MEKDKVIIIFGCYMLLEGLIGIVFILLSEYLIGVSLLILSQLEYIGIKLYRIDKTLRKSDINNSKLKGEDKESVV